MKPHLKTFVLWYHDDKPYPPHSCRISIYIYFGLIFGVMVLEGAYELYLGPLRIAIY